MFLDDNRELVIKLLLNRKDFSSIHKRLTDIGLKVSYDTTVSYCRHLIKENNLKISKRIRREEFYDKVKPFLLEGYNYSQIHKKALDMGMNISYVTVLNWCKIKNNTEIIETKVDIA